MPNKIGFHKNATGGHASGLDEFMVRQDAAGIRFTINCVNDAALAVRAASFTGADHVIVFRETEWSGAPTAYDTPAREVALAWWMDVLGKMPPEIVEVKDRVWIEPINEPDKNNAGWIGHFMVNIARIANEMGWRVCGPSWATGNPEYSHYEESGMLEWMQYCADNPTMAAQAIHEYSLTTDDLLEAEGYLLGRFRDYMFDVCDANGIDRPPVIVTELGWTHRDMPEVPAALEDISHAAALYDPHPQVMGTCLWTLGSGPEWGDLPAQMEQIVLPLADWIVSEYEGEEPTPGPDPVKEPAVVRHEVHLLPQSATSSQAAQLARLLEPKKTTFTHSHDTVEAIMFHSKPNGSIVAWDPDEWDLGLEERFAWLGVQYEERALAQLDEPLFGLRLASPFRKPAGITSSFNAPRNYGLHEGVDIDIFGEPADSKEPVLAMANGHVVASEFTSRGYGHYVVVESVWKGITYRVWYAHMDSRLVSTGETVTVGQRLGELGGTGGGWNEHVHLNLQVPGHGLNGYFVSDVINPAPYISLEPQSSLEGHDMAEFLLPRDGQRGDIVILANNWGQGDERQQLQSDFPLSYVVKNQQWERREIGRDVIWFQVDTSPGHNQFYVVRSDTGWMPRRWSPGDEFKRIEHVEFYDKGNCQLAAEFGSASLLKFNAFYDRFTTRGGVVVDGVAEVQWVRNGTVEETYWYARNLGLVQWESRHGLRSSAVELIPRGDQADNQRENVECPQTQFV